MKANRKHDGIPVSCHTCNPIAAPQDSIKEGVELWQYVHGIAAEYIIVGMIITLYIITI